MADLNGDTFLDIVVVGSAVTAELSVHINLGDGTFAPGFVCPSQTPLRWVDLGDVDNDGLNDAVLTVS